jgi:hypothetical protein
MHGQGAVACGLHLPWGLAPQKAAEEQTELGTLQPRRLATTQRARTLSWYSSMGTSSGTASCCRAALGLRQRARL